MYNRVTLIFLCSFQRAVVTPMLNLEALWREYNAFEQVRVFSNSLNLLDTLAVCLLAFFQTLLETFNFSRQWCKWAQKDIITHFCWWQSYNEQNSLGTKFWICWASVLAQNVNYWAASNCVTTHMPCQNCVAWSKVQVTFHRSRVQVTAPSINYQTTQIPLDLIEHLLRDYRVRRHVY